jgi:hypothetical protein
MPSVLVLWYILIMQLMMTALMTGQNAMEITWNREMVTWRVQKTLRLMMLALMKWTLVTVVFIGKDMAKWGSGKRLYRHLSQVAIF